MKTPTLESLIKKAKFNWKNDNITSKNFPPQPIRGKVEIFHFNESLESEEVIKRLDEKGYEPANAYELLAYAGKEWNGKDWVVALGSAWQSFGGGRGVAYLSGGSGGRDLCLVWWSGGWGSYYRFAAIKKEPVKVALLSDTRKLGTLKPLDTSDLERRVKELENKMSKIEKIINL